jgi:AraC-like DNA-binding protein
MSNPSIRRGIASTRLLCGLADDHGLDRDDCLRGAAIAPALLDDPNAEIEAAQEFRVIANLIVLLGARGISDIEIALAAGARYHLTTMGIWGFAMAASPTLGSAVQVGLRYLDLTYSVNRIWLDEAADSASLVIDDKTSPAALAQFVVLRDMAAIMTLNRELLAAPVLPHAAQLRFPAPSAAVVRQLEATFGAVPQFDAPRNALAFDLAIFAQPLPQANALMRQACEDQCRALLARRRGRTGQAGRVRDRLLRDPGRMPDMDAIAAELNVTARHLRRLLSAEGTSYRALADEVRQALAEELLATARMKMDEVAERLGYAERASFVHAFKRWKGVSPSAFRG